MEDLPPPLEAMAGAGFFLSVSVKEDNKSVEEEQDPLTAGWDGGCGPGVTPGAVGRDQSPRWDEELVLLPRHPRLQHGSAPAAQLLQPPRMRSGERQILVPDLYEYRFSLAGRGVGTGFALRGHISEGLFQASAESDRG